MKKHWALYALYLMLFVVAIVVIMKHEPITAQTLVLSLLGGVIWGMFLGNAGDLQGGLLGGVSLGAILFVGTIVNAWQLNIWVGAIVALAAYASFWAMYLAIWFQKPMPTRRVK